MTARKPTQEEMRATLNLMLNGMTQEEAIKLLNHAYVALMRRGWQLMQYAPKEDGSRFDVIELGSVLVHKCVVKDGTCWIPDNIDTWPSEPVLFRAQQESDKKEPNL
ncbi:MAG TPA: hypothetical protein VM120_19345 [Bryobacteraceae bacterium]|nr:hypothetical protein [Bryobacteraceae bacterium]